MSNTNTISFTIPATVSAMTHMATMLQGMIADAGPDRSMGYRDYDNAKAPAGTTPFKEKLAQVVEKADKKLEKLEEFQTELARYGGVQAGPDTTAEAAFTNTADISNMVEAGKSASTATTPEVLKQPEASSSAAVGVELDSEGLPWDGRINPASRSRLAKTDAWKKKRGIDDALVATVQAELRQALAAGGPVVDTPAVVTQGPVINTPVIDTVAITTFPALVAAITAAGLPTDAVTAVCVAVGVSGLPMLAISPAQIPTVAAALGL